LFLFILSASLYAELKVIVDDNRFLDDKSNTILEINYEIPYNELQFIKTENGFEAQLKTDLKVMSDEREVYQQDFTNQIILTNQELISSAEPFRDKITLTLAKSGFVIKLNFTDLMAETESDWEYLFQTLDQDSMLSDLEFSSQIISDSTDYLQKFHRWNYLFLVNTSHIYDLQKFQKILLYYEIRSFFKDTDDRSDLTEIITISKNDEVIKKDEVEIRETNDLINRIKELDIENLEPAYYSIEVKIIDNISGYQEVKKDFFSIKAKVELDIRIFPDLEDDFRLVKYFLPSSQTKIWKDLTESGKRNYLKRFWQLNDPDPQTEENEFLTLVKKRLEYSNLNFSHFEAGWSTDRGRIYLRKGEPDEILKLKTGFYTKYAIKDYEIWKYRKGEMYTYVFIDLLTSGNYKLIYSENDDREITLPDWANYLDKDFDESLLE